MTPTPYERGHADYYLTVVAEHKRYHIPPNNPYPEDSDEAILYLAGWTDAALKEQAADILKGKTS